MFGVYSRYESDHNGAYSLLAGVEVAPIERVPAELHTVSIPAAEYFFVPGRRRHAASHYRRPGRVWRYFEDGRAQRVAIAVRLRSTSSVIAPRIQTARRFSYRCVRRHNAGRTLPRRYSANAYILRTLRS